MSKHRLFFNNSREILSPNVELKDDLLDANDYELADYLQDENVKYKRETIVCTTDRNQYPTIQDSDSDSESVNAFFVSTFNKKLPYTMQEDEMILKFVLKGQNIFKTSSLSMWKYLETKKDNPKRTYQSLKNRFLRNIKPRLFTTYRHMVKDTKTVEKILSKFPELQEYVQRDLKLKLTYRNPLFEPNEENEMSSDESNGLVHIVKEELEDENFSESNPLHNIPHPIFFHPALTENSNEFKQIKFINDNLFITVRNEKVPDENLDFRQEGIYEKYLRLKKNNVILPCPHCGRGDIESMEDEERESEDVIIEDSQSKGNCISEIGNQNAGGKDGEQISQKIHSSPSLLQQESPGKHENHSMDTKHENGMDVENCDKVDAIPIDSTNRSSSPHPHSEASKDSSGEGNPNFSRRKTNNSDCPELIPSDESESISETGSGKSKRGINGRKSKRKSSAPKKSDSSCSPSSSPSSSTFSLTLVNSSSSEMKKPTLVNIEQLIDKSNETLIRNMAKMVHENLSRKKQKVQE